MDFLLCILGSSLFYIILILIVSVFFLLKYLDKKNENDKDLNSSKELNDILKDKLKEKIDSENNYNSNDIDNYSNNNNDNINDNINNNIEFYRSYYEKIINYLRNENDILKRKINVLVENQNNNNNNNNNVNNGSNCDNNNSNNSNNEQLNNLIKTLKDENNMLNNIIFNNINYSLPNNLKYYPYNYILENINQQKIRNIFNFTGCIIHYNKTKNYYCVDSSLNIYKSLKIKNIGNNGKRMYEDFNTNHDEFYIAAIRLIDSEYDNTDKLEEMLNFTLNNQNNNDNNNSNNNYDNYNNKEKIIEEREKENRTSNMIKLNNNNNNSNINNSNSNNIIVNKLVKLNKLFKTNFDNENDLRMYLIENSDLEDRLNIFKSNDEFNFNNKYTINNLLLSINNLKDELQSIGINDQFCFATITTDGNLAVVGRTSINSMDINTTLYENGNNKTSTEMIKYCNIVDETNSNIDFIKDKVIVFWCKEMNKENISKFEEAIGNYLLLNHYWIYNTFSHLYN